MKIVSTESRYKRYEVPMIGVGPIRKILLPLDFKSNAYANFATSAEFARLPSESRSDFAGYAGFATAAEPTYYISYPVCIAR